MRKKALLSANVFLDSVKFLVYEFNYVAALEAYQVMVVWASERLLVPRGVFGKSIFGNQSALLKYVKRVIDSGFRNFHTTCDESVVERFCVEVAL